MKTHKLGHIFLFSTRSAQDIWSVAKEKALAVPVHEPLCTHEFKSKSIVTQNSQAMDAIDGSNARSDKHDRVEKTSSNSDFRCKTSGQREALPAVVMIIVLLCGLLSGEAFFQCFRDTLDPLPFALRWAVRLAASLMGAVLGLQLVRS